MNKQRMVIYDQRDRVLHGEDLSEQVYQWIDEAIEHVVDEYTSNEYAEEWDVGGLVAAATAVGSRTEEGASPADCTVPYHVDA